MDRYIHVLGDLMRDAITQKISKSLE